MANHTEAIETLTRERIFWLNYKPKTKEERIRREEKLTALKASIKKLQS